MFRLSVILIIIVSCNMQVYATQSLKSSEVHLSDPFVHLLYSLEIAQLCGHNSDSVRQGYELEKSRIINELNLSKQATAEKSITASVLVDLEWQNLGLGGFKYWCAKEAADAADYFVKIYNGFNKDE